MKIRFTDTIGIDKAYHPTPASNAIPLWYKNLESYIGGEKKPSGSGTTSATIKRCMPVFDAITAGYILYSPTDIYISQKNGEQWYEWPSWEVLKFHPIEQAPNHPAGVGHKISYPKWINPWAIETPKGYSCLFIPPVHRESVFSILEGVVDTDEYKAPVNFPFVLNNPKFEGMIPAGTPIVQVIPFKRDNWKMEFGSKENVALSQKVTNKLTAKFFDSYKSQFRKPKEYR
jgi:hypothetical protein